MARKLTDKQKKFVEEYLIDLNATQACIRAGYSPKTAMEQGYQLLQKTSVQEAIAECMAARSRRTGVNQDRVVLELAKIAFVRMPDVVTVTEESNRMHLLTICLVLNQSNIRNLIMNLEEVLKEKSRLLPR